MPRQGRKRNSEAKRKAQQFERKRNRRESRRALDDHVDTRQKPCRSSTVKYVWDEGLSRWISFTRWEQQNRAHVPKGEAYPVLFRLGDPLPWSPPTTGAPQDRTRWTAAKSLSKKKRAAGSSLFSCA